MSNLVEAFVSESRELLEQVASCFLKLEEQPDDGELLNEVFRAVHTIKGASGLFDIQPLTSVVHAGEDVLDLVRSGKLGLTSDYVDLLLEAMDQVGEWLDALESDGGLDEEASVRGRTIADGLRAIIANAVAAGEVEQTAAKAAPAQAAEAAETAATTTVHTWASVEELGAVPSAVVESLEARGGLLTSLTFEPHEQCFFQGHDPVNMVLNLPGLEWFEIQTREPWPDLAAFDPYRCILRFRVVSSAEEEKIAHHFRYVAEHVTMKSVSAPTSKAVTDVEVSEVAVASGTSTVTSVATHAPTTGAPPPSGPAATEDSDYETQLAREMLTHQVELLSLPASREGLAGTVRSVSRVAARLLPRLGVDVSVQDLEACAARSIEAGSGAALGEFIEQLVPGVRGEKAGPQAAAQSRADGPGKAQEAAPPQQGGGATAEAAPAPAAAPRKSEEAEGSKLSKARALKVDQARIDALMDLVGQLVVAKNALPFLAKRAEEVFGVRELAREVKSQHAVINRLAEDLQHAVMQVRMVPVSTAFQRFPRLVRDLSRKLKKEVRLVIQGEETEADKNVVEEIGDPLIHIIRNSLDHGIETPQEREAAGKSPMATLTLRAHQLDDRVVIEIIDDGRGIDPEKIKRIAYQKGVITEETLESISDADALQLIFAAGFSTAEKISDVSGRGVGMDVVRTVIRKSGGSVNLSSQIGVGTTVRLELPLSMAVTQVMMVRIGEEDFGIPFDSVRETVRVPANDIRLIKNRECIVLRERLLPLFRLRDLLEVKSEHEQEETHAGQEAVLVVGIGAEEVGLIVDDFHEAIDIILKPLEGVLNGLRTYSGTALLGDGRVLLVLNVGELTRCLSRV